MKNETLKTYEEKEEEEEEEEDDDDDDDDDEDDEEEEEICNYYKLLLRSARITGKREGSVYIFMEYVRIIRENEEGRASYGVHKRDYMESQL